MFVFILFGMIVTGAIIADSDRVELTPQQRLRIQRDIDERRRNIQRDLQRERQRERNNRRFRR